MTPEEIALMNQQIAAANAAHEAYIRANETQTPLTQETVVQMQQQQQIQNTWVQPTTESEWAADAQREALKRQQAFSQPRDDTQVPLSPAAQAIQDQYALQHYAIIGSGRTLYPTGDQYGRYYYADTGEPFQATVLTTDQQRTLQMGIQSPSPLTSPLQQLMADPTLTHVAPGVIAGFISPMVGPQTAQELGGFLASPEQREPFQQWFFGTSREGYADAFTPMSAAYMGRSETPFALPPGTATERFGFDEYGNILGSGFVNYPVGAFNPKMGSGDYVYVGEYHYLATGETVSRYYERSVGSFIDVSPQGVFTEPKIMGVRSGGSPGSFTQTMDYAIAYGNIPATTPRTVVMGTAALGTGPTVVQGYGEESAKRPFVSANAPQGVFQAPEAHIFGMHVPVVSGVAEFFMGGKETTTFATATKIPESTRLVGTQVIPIEGGTKTISTFETTGGTNITNTTVTKPMPSAYEMKEASWSQKAYALFGKTFGVTGEEAKLRTANVATFFETVANKAPIFAPYAAGAGTVKEFLETPGKAAVFTGVGLAFGGITKVATSVGTFGRVRTAERVISSGGMWRSTEMVGSAVMNYGPKVLGGLYAYDVAGRVTQGFKNIQPGSVAVRAGPIMMLEAGPMALGFGIPETAVTRVRTSA